MVGNKGSLKVSPDKWPDGIRPGVRVYFIGNSIMGRGWDVESGVVRAYNPALEQCSVVTKGKPFFTVVTDGDRYELPGVGDVAPHTPGGMRKLEAVVRKRMEAAANELERRAAAIRAELAARPRAGRR